MRDQLWLTLATRFLDLSSKTKTELQSHLWNSSEKHLFLDWLDMDVGHSLFQCIKFNTNPENGDLKWSFIDTCLVVTAVFNPPSSDCFHAWLRKDWKWLAYNCAYCPSVLVKACGSSPRPSGRRPSRLHGSAGITAHVKHHHMGRLRLRRKRRRKTWLSFEWKFKKRNKKKNHLAVS